MRYVYAHRIMCFAEERNDVLFALLSNTDFKNRDAAEWKPSLATAASNSGLSEGTLGALMRAGLYFATSSTVRFVASASELKTVVPLSVFAMAIVVPRSLLASGAKTSIPQKSPIEISALLLGYLYGHLEHP